MKRWRADRGNWDKLQTPQKLSHITKVSRGTVSYARTLRSGKMSVNV